MSKRLELTVEDAVQEYDEEIGEEDYGFIFDANGDLKFAFIPEFPPDKPPKNIQKMWVIANPEPSPVRQPSGCGNLAN